MDIPSMKIEDCKGTVQLPSGWWIMYDVTVEGWSGDHPTSMAFHIYEYSDNKPIVFGDHDGELLYGYIKWDGCSNWSPNGEDFHLCGKDRLIDLMNAMQACYHIAGKLIPDHNP